MNSLFSFLIFLVFAGFLVHLAVAARIPGVKTVIRDNVKSGHFCYDDASCAPPHWDGICNDANHKHQSPIDIQVSPSNFKDNFQVLEFSQTYNNTFDSFYIENNGHSIQISLTEDDDDDNQGSRNIRFSYGSGKEYIFSQIHFHWGSQNDQGSEHTMNSTSFPMEIHLVHYSAKYDGLGKALDDSAATDSLSVIGVFVEVLPDCKSNTVFQDISKALKTVVKKPSEKIRVQEPLKIGDFLPEILDYYSYDGSLTTPSCAEAVRWSVIQKPICISSKNLKEFRKVKTEDGSKLLSNHRPTQSLGDRKVTFNRVSPKTYQPKDASAKKWPANMRSGRRQHVLGEQIAQQKVSL